MIYCYEDDPSNVVSPSSVANEHDDHHDISGVSDMQHLPLSEKTKKLIMQRLKEGFAVRAKKIVIQNNFCQYIRDNLAMGTSFGSSIVHHPDQIIHADENYKKNPTSLQNTNKNL
ncbi:hypothetical protein HMPREF1544_00453 [Mucor circinelloides 1006PhL]|uniref:Uncharacterized protein n=1 Tax=Mucor circinelloides f. circinelloides (strain 1006PhL) TaxID=1220926 RepID=S2JRV6_MUCC1|nr:hypothetical protein HMPREF1544_00453 [Mucor circinelloides 1006PhL]